MFNAIRFLTAMISLLTAGTHPTRHEAEPVTVITGMAAAEEQATQRSLALFGQAGLPLPPVEIRRHRDTAGCNGHEGLHRRFGERSVIDICTTESGDYEQRTIIHELGHAWSFHYMTDAQRTAFQQLRGWSAWLNNDQAWKTTAPSRPPRSSSGRSGRPNPGRQDRPEQLRRTPRRVRRTDRARAAARLTNLCNSVTTASRS